MLRVIFGPMKSPFSRLMTCVLLLGLAATFNAPGADAAKKARAKRPPNPVFEKITDQPGLPRVLLIGDSISIGYTLDVRAKLKGKANVHRIPVNGGPTTTGLANLKTWLGNEKWDVIHFNWGLHDLKYMGADNKNLADPKAAGSRQQVPVDQYEQNLRELVKQMKATGATLIWCSTTPVPEGADGRVPGDEVKYNQAAARVMKENQVAIDDLCAHARPELKRIQRPANVHFSDEGSEFLARKVAASIEAVLPKSSGSPRP